MIAYLFHCFQVLFLLSCFIVSLVTLFRKVAAVWIFASIVPLVLMVLYVVCSFMDGCVYIWRHVFSYCSRHLDRSFPNFKWIVLLVHFFFLGDELLERQTSIYFQKQQLTAVELLKYKSTHNSNWICWTVVCASRVVVLYPFVAHPSPQQHFEDSTSASGDQLVSSDQNIYQTQEHICMHMTLHTICLLFKRWYCSCLFNP